MKRFPPLSVEAKRGVRMESLHLVDVAVFDSEGEAVLVRGDCDGAIFPRSAIKPLQALALMESGAVERFGLDSRHVAMACASHNGEPFHVEAVREMLKAAGLGESHLECGVQRPTRASDRDALAERGEKAGAVHNNCSGKHAGFLCCAAHRGYETKGYVRFDHPVQREIAAILSEVTGETHGEENRATDGCSIPTYSIALKGLALGIARFGTGRDSDSTRSGAMIRIRDACLSHPELIGGTGRFDTDLMSGLGNRALTKTGAEGVFAASLPELGFGIALKARDGARRAAESATAFMIDSLLKETEKGLSDSESALLGRLSNPVLRNWNGIEVGEVRVSSG